MKKLTITGNNISQKQWSNLVLELNLMKKAWKPYGVNVELIPASVNFKSIKDLKCNIIVGANTICVFFGCERITNNSILTIENYGTLKFSFNQTSKLLNHGKIKISSSYKKAVGFVSNTGLTFVKVDFINNGTLDIGSEPSTFEICDVPTQGCIIYNWPQSYQGKYLFNFISSLFKF